MEAFFRKLGSGSNIVIVPKMKVEQDGHPILVYQYDIYRASESSIKDMLPLKAVLSEDEKKIDPDYVGVLTFEIPGKLFTYDFQENKELDTADEQEIISLVTDIRESSGSWNFYGENNTGHIG
jgi:hypothetical protein